MQRRKAYAALTGLPESAVNKLDETRWVKRIRSRLFGPILRGIILLVPIVPLLFFILGILLADVPPFDSFLKTSEPQEIVVVDVVLDLIKRLFLPKCE